MSFIVWKEQVKESTHSSKAIIQFSIARLDNYEFWELRKHDN